MTFSRRDFIKLLGISSLTLPLPFDLLAQESLIQGLSPDTLDRLKTINGIDWKILVKEGDPISNTLNFGTNNDYLQFFAQSTNRGILWCNHEYLNPLLSSKPQRDKKTIDHEMTLVGGSLIEIIRDKQNWSIVKDSSFNRRLDAKTQIPFANDVEIVGSKFAIGTLANCAGGKTPWSTVLTCEENYDAFFGETDFKTKKHVPSQWLKWDEFYQHPPEHYGWVVEVNPLTGEAKKHTSLGRFAHECATMRLASDKIPVVYSGDDEADEHLYKFISNQIGSLEIGTLYVANLEKGQWIPLIHSDSRLKKVFKDQTDILIHCREAAKLVGATPLDRPEDIEVDPITGDVLIACTNNKKANRPHGKILKIKENNNDPKSLNFSHEVFLSGGEQSGLSCPDNLAFDKNGNLWVTTDISGYEMHKPHYKNFGNNGLFVIQRSGPQAGKPIQIASAPKDAEFTGPVFSPDYKTLFLSVQHPGELTVNLEKPTSSWPTGHMPKSAVITLSGPTLNQITGAK